MKKCNLFLAIVLVFIVTNLYSQSYETLTKVYIPPSATIIKTTKVKNCYDTVRAGNVVKQEQTKTNGKITYTITKNDTLRRDTPFPFEKTIQQEMQGFDGYANITSDDKDNSILHINYWLNPTNTVKAGKKIRIRDRTLNCDTTYSEKITDLVLQNDTSFVLLKWDKKKDSLKIVIDTLFDWFKNANKIIEVFDSKTPTQIDYYLVNKYDNNADYSMALENRDFLSYHQRSFEFGPITIPFKWRFAYTKNAISVKQEFTADLNVGAFAGYRLGRYRIRYEGTKLKELPSFSISMGGFLNLSTVTLDSLATTVVGKAGLTKDEKSTVGILSPGVGLMINVYDFQFGAFLGLDMGFGVDSKKWNFNNMPWLGFGFSYNLLGFWKK